mmetsp:Transcript_17600/g.61919  ORF Transcript_17600/g.61919 Transcript_17600/m.61919 type:complete len:364 (+) Transcript_17600:1470-2561(+)
MRRGVDLGVLAVVVVRLVVVVVVVLLLLRRRRHRLGRQSGGSSANGRQALGALHLGAPLARGARVGEVRRGEQLHRRRTIRRHHRHHGAQNVERLRREARREAPVHHELAHLTTADAAEGTVSRRRARVHARSGEKAEENDAERVDIGRRRVVRAAREHLRRHVTRLARQLAVSNHARRAIRVRRRQLDAEAIVGVDEADAARLGKLRGVDDKHVLRGHVAVHALQDRVHVRQAGNQPRKCLTRRVGRHGAVGLQQREHVAPRAREDKGLPRRTRLGRLARQRQLAHQVRVRRHDEAREGRRLLLKALARAREAAGKARPRRWRPPHVEQLDSAIARHAVGTHERRVQHAAVDAARDRPTDLV